MSASRHVAVELRGSAAIIWLDRPASLNAFTIEMLEELRTAVADAEADPQVVGIVLTGVGRGFCSGFDASALAALAGGAAPVTTPRRPDDPLGVFSYLVACDKPVIAAVNGAAAGGGFVLALMADLRFANREASFVPGFAEIGLVAEHGSAWLLPRLVGTSCALNLLWSKTRLSGVQAEATGLVDHLEAADGDVADAAATYVNDLAATVSPASLRDTKRLVYRGWSAAFRDALTEVDCVQNASVTRGDVVEGLRARAESRRPRFAGLAGGDDARAAPPV